MAAPELRRGSPTPAIDTLSAESARALEPALVALLKDSDTRHGDPSEALYRSLGWERAGVIPRYARSADGALDPSAFYYRLLDPGG